MDVPKGEPMPTEDQIRAMMPKAGDRLTPHLPFINHALEFGEINTPLRIAAFMAQLAHESGEYRYMEEIDEGHYLEGRTDIGNTEPGDGPRFKGHGPIQLTGRAVHATCGQALGIDLIAHPELITTPEYGTLSSAWFWHKYKPALNPAADKGWFRVTTRLVNGGYNHLDRRIAYYQTNRALLGLGAYSEQDEDQSIRQFQASKGLVVDGDAGRNTLKVLLA